MTNGTTGPPPSNRRRSPPAGFRTSLKTRLRWYAFVGVAIVGSWLYYTVGTVRALYDVTGDIERNTELVERVRDAESGLREAQDGIERFTQSGQGYDLSRYQAGRVRLRTALGAIARGLLSERDRGLLHKAASAEEVFVQSAQRAAAAWRAEDPAPAALERDTLVSPAADELHVALMDLDRNLGRTQSLAEDRLRDARDRATIALVILALLVLAALVWLLRDVNRRILTPCAATVEALGDLIADRPTPRLPDVSHDELGELAHRFNAAAARYEERARALEERDIQASVNEILAAAATVNDLAGFGSRVLEKILQVSGASSAVLYLPDGTGEFRRSVATGGDVSPDDATGRAEAARAAREGRSIYLSVDPQSPTINVFDGRILPRESAHIPLIYFDHPVGVLALGATRAFTPRTINALAAIAPSLAVALANASVNERVTEQSRRLTEQNELLEDQRSRLARTARELQRASALKDRFLASVSHELRTPMTVILGFTGALLRGGQGALNPQQRESLDRVHRNARLLLGLINDILDISKIEAGKMDIERQRVHVPALLQQIRTDFAAAAKQKGLELEVEADPGVEEVTTDPAKVTQILANLIGNALKFTERGSIRVRAQARSSDRWALIVEDTGLGIPEEEQESIFEEFRQGDAPEHRGRGGTGLGLAIVKKIALLLGGRVALDSAPGRGSRFTVTLPREIPGDTAQGSLPIPASRTGSGGERTVLIVDDDESIRKLLRFELEPYGIRVLESENGARGVELARAEKPDAILLDVLMPGLDGWQTLRELKDSPETRSIPVLLLSVVEDRAFGFSLGAFDYLLKPLNRADLFETLERAGVLASRGYVLLVDDDPDLRTLLSQELAGVGYRVRTAAGGEAALAELEHERPSAVLLDLNMPPPDGFDVLFRMRQSESLRDIPVIVVTARELLESDYARLNGSAQRIIRKRADLGGLAREVLRSLEPEKVAARR
ncbi:MAG: response regulator [Thermoanaerobaculia bacterium]